MFFHFLGVPWLYTHELSQGEFIKYIPNTISN